MLINKTPVLVNYSKLNKRLMCGLILIQLQKLLKQNTREERQRAGERDHILGSLFICHSVK